MELSLPPAPSFVPPESKPARKGEVCVCVCVRCVIFFACLKSFENMTCFVVNLLDFESVGILFFCAFVCMYMCVPTGVLVCTPSLSLSLSLPIVRVLWHSVLTALQTLGVSAAGVALVADGAAYCIRCVCHCAESRQCCRSLPEG
jgi:hypothetical protein